MSAIGAALSFPFTNVGSTSVPQTLKLTNIGNQSLSVSNISSPTDFPLQSTSTCTNGENLASGSNCSVTYAFAPSEGGVLSETSTLTDNNLNVSGAQQV